MGDTVLQAVADILPHSVEPEDMVSRVGGDEFMLIIESRGHHFIDDIIGKIEDNVKTYDQVEKNIQLGLTYGIESVDNPSDYNINDLLHWVDQKMYHNKGTEEV